MAKRKYDGAAILALPMKKNDSGARTVRGYLVALLSQLWEEGEGFSGKRPFGNSGWECDFAEPLIAAKIIDADGQQLTDAVHAAIDALGKQP